MKIGVIDAGGGMRGIYGCGVLDTCIDDGVVFDICIGVSAGSANLASYVASQRGRNYPFYAEYSFRREYMGMGNLLKNGSYLDLSYVYETLSNEGGENPLDYDALMKSKSELFILAEKALSGKAKYFAKEDIKRNDYRALIASSNIPGINKAFDYDGTLYFDGGLADPIPIKKAFSLGCDKVVVILTKPVRKEKITPIDRVLAAIISRQYPASAKRLLSREERYNKETALAKKLEEKGRLLIVAPKTTEGISTLIKNKEAFARLYERGLRDGKKIKTWLESC